MKLVHTALVEKRDPRKMVSTYLMAYRATPHKVTGRSPAELLFNRRIRTKLPGLRVQQEGDMDREVRERHEKEKVKQKSYADEKRKARPKEVKLGDQIMIQQRKSTIKTPWDPRPYTVTQVKGSQVEVKRGDEVKRRALNLIKKIKSRKGAEKRETKEIEEDPDIDITIEEIRERIRKEKDAAEGGARENSRLEESTDSDFTITYEGVPGSPEQDCEGARVRLDVDTSQDSVSPGRSNNNEEPSGGKAPRLSPKQRNRRQSLARFKKKQWGEDWVV